MTPLLIILTLSLATAADAKVPVLAINDLILQQDRPTTVISFLSPNIINPLNLAKALNKTTLVMRNSFSSSQDLMMKEDHPFFIVDLQDNRTINILHKAQKEHKMIIPARWLLIIEIEANNDDELRNIIEEHLTGINIGINTEIYIAIVIVSDCEFFSVYRINPKSFLIWKLYGTWTESSRLKITVSTESLPMSRRDLQGYTVKSNRIVTVNATLDNLKDYQRRDEDTYTKYCYYMINHIVEFMNGTLVLNYTDNWGYPQPDGTFNGIVREIQDGRSDFSATPFAPITARLPIVQYVLSPASMGAMFIFKKPSLAAVTNIYVLPFSGGVWAGMMVLIVFCTIALFISSFVEEYYSVNEDVVHESAWDRISDSVLDTLSFVFQQGVCRDPNSISSRQILLLGLMVFMFLFTSYSANVVALLQSTTNDIKDVKDLLRSPLKLGLQEAIYNEVIFAGDTRPAHQILYRQKLLSQGGKAYATVEDGIRRIRNDMYAFHVQQTAGYDEIQRTFWDDEKCNLGQVVFTSFNSPYLGVGYYTHIRELFRIGAVRVMEGGVQSRSTRRVVSARPTCSSQAAMFAAVELPHVAPAFRALIAAFILSVIILIAEIIVFSHNQKKAIRRQVLTSESISSEE